MTTISTTSSGGSITSGNTDTVVAGGNVTSFTVSSGGSLIISGGTDSATTVLAGGSETVSSGSASGDQIYGTVTVSGSATSNATVTSETIYGGGTLDLYKGTASATTVDSGGKLFISGGNTASNTVLSGGGTVELNTSGAVLSGSLTFEGGSNTLQLDKVLSSTAGDQAVISGFFHRPTKSS
jgi:autotransporter passenger strand-loop-strand repeat protein